MTRTATATRSTAIAIVLALAVVVPADARAAAPQLGAMGRMLLLVPDTAPTRVEAIVNDYDLAREHGSIAVPLPGDAYGEAQYELAMTTMPATGVAVVPSTRSLTAASFPFSAVDADVSAGPVAIAIVRDHGAVGTVDVSPWTSLATRADLGALAAALDGLRVHAAAFTTDVARFARPSPAPDGAPGDALEPYRALATGIGRDGSGPFVAVAVVARDHDAAARDAARLRAIVTSGTDVVDRRPWSDLLRVERVDVVGDVVVAVLPTRVPALWLATERQPNSLVWWA